MSALFAFLLTFLALFLILLVLVQRGRGGGLAGALGGMGGSSAFGAKAGDVFTRITVITAAIWISLSLAAVLWAKHKGDVLGSADVASPAADQALDLLPQKARTDATGPPAATAAPAKTESPAAGPPATESAPAGPSIPATDNAAPPAQTE